MSSPIDRIRDLAAKPLHDSQIVCIGDHVMVGDIRALLADPRLQLDVDDLRLCTQESPDEWGARVHDARVRVRAALNGERAGDKPFEPFAGLGVHTSTCRAEPSCLGCVDIDERSPVADWGARPDDPLTSRAEAPWPGGSGVVKPALCSPVADAAPIMTADEIAAHDALIGSPVADEPAALLAVGDAVTVRGRIVEVMPPIDVDNVRLYRVAIEDARTQPHVLVPEPANAVHPLDTQGEKS